MGLFDKVFGSYSEKELKRVRPQVDRVLALEEQYRTLSDAELRATTPKLKERLAQGETLDALLPDAFAACREAADYACRKLGWARIICGEGGEPLPKEIIADRVFESVSKALGIEL